MDIPNRKISALILEFGEPLLSELDLSDQFEMGSACRLLVTIWNAVTLDQHGKTRSWC